METQELYPDEYVCEICGEVHRVEHRGEHTEECFVEHAESTNHDTVRRMWDYVVESGLIQEYLDYIARRMEEEWGGPASEDEEESEAEEEEDEDEAEDEEEEDEEE